MQKLGVNELREKFLTFFESKGHLRAESAPLVPHDDASLLFINSGMAPLKPYFSGEVMPPRKRMTTCQKCIRTPDIENVGKTSRHGTFFEMLGNFSFGDYFKRDATAWAWEFFTKILEIPVELLYVSVYLEDDEAFDIWTKEVGVDPSHMVRLGKADNFWEIGSGPCGPCSEIYFDRGEANGCSSPDCKVGCDCDRYVEIWNLVFTQFNNDGQGNYTPLAQKNIDTGMGLERLACVMQGVSNLFEVDTVQNILTAAAGLAGKKYKVNTEDDISLRVITDHIRSVTMMVCDGALPSNEGRGYVLRRLLRRAARHGRLLGIKGTFLHELCDVVIQESGTAYPELVARKDYIKRVIRVEEERFEQTIDAGLKILTEIVGELVSKGISVMSGADAFKLYDTYGFPFMLTEEILAERGLSLDNLTFDRLMNEQRERARKARAALGDFGWDDADLGMDNSTATHFVGYDVLESDVKIIHILTPDGQLEQAAEGDKVTLVLDITPFYAESGGQSADSGIIENDSGVFRVDAVKKTKDGHFLHIGEILSGELSNGLTVSAKVDKARRSAIMRAHSATHLLHKALREVLGTHVEQAGSLVEPDKLRFDFTHFSHLTPEEISAVRERVVEYIYQGENVCISEMPIDDARKKGAMALFGEKYGNVVRVVEMENLSIELCGGTHVNNTAKIGAFAMRGDSSVAAGVRRIEARTGKLLLQELNSISVIMDEITGMLKVPMEGIRGKIEERLNEIKTLKKASESAKANDLRADAEQALSGAKEISGLRVATLKSDSLGADALRSIGDFMRDKDSSVVGVITSTAEDKLTVLAVCGKDAVAKGVKAGDLIKKICAITGGGGGGRPDSAMGGGDVSKVDAGLAAVADIIAESIK